MKKLLFIAALWLVIPLFANADSQQEISKQQFGAKWPLSVPSGMVKCLPIGRGAVVFESQEKIYAVNGIAKGVARKHRFSNIEEIWLDDPEFYKIAEEAARMEDIPVEKAIKLMGGPTKINIAPVLDAGARLCNR
ncbi:MAG: hypothetical protein TQ37_02535 [Candidatus Synechococcus spongiarum 15L]|uniref:DUF2511 domain-containing protein n=1 Tax=Candidatus Synechococcus spongiarum 15L TaxID=1608419 RepID=A0A0G8AXW7_9SYNE|nr:MAG: hypothetical protein TQ37_02535 [Candidatus Synechococcus spongiarum 15L]MCY4614631.1 DUF2511 domain-containing protein [Nitrospira sp.]